MDLGSNKEMASLIAGALKELFESVVESRKKLKISPDKAQLEKNASLVKESSKLEKKISKVEKEIIALLSVPVDEVENREEAMLIVRQYEAMSKYYAILVQRINEI